MAILDGTERVGASVRIIEVSGPLDLVRTMSGHLVGGSDPSMHLAPDDVWRCTRTPDGAATMRVTRIRIDAETSSLSATAWGAGAGWALDHVAELLGLDDDPTAFDPAPDLVRDLHRRHPGLRMGRSRAITETLVPTILEQKVASVEAHRSYRALMRAYGEPAPGPRPALVGGLFLRPDPARLARLGYADFHGFGIERRRADTIRRVCARAASIDRLALEWTPALPGSAAAITTARHAIESLPGIGPWSSAIVAQRAFGDSDAVIVGDHNFPHLVAWNLAGERRATDERMLELLEPFRGHRGRVVRLLGLGGGRAPRRAPRRRLRSIARI